MRLEERDSVFELNLESIAPCQVACVAQSTEFRRPEWHFELIDRSHTIETKLRRLQIRSDVARTAERFVRHFDRSIAQQFADAEVFLTDELDADDVAFLVEVNHRETVLPAERHGPRNSSPAESYISGRRFRIDFDHRRACGPDDKGFNALLPSKR